MGRPAAAASEAPGLEAGEHGLDDRRGGRGPLGVQLGREADLGVDDAVGRQVLGALARPRGERVLGLEHRDGVREALEVPHEVARRGSSLRTTRRARRGPWSGRPCSRRLAASSMTVSGRSPPSRWSWRRTFGAREELVVGGHRRRCNGAVARRGSARDALEHERAGARRLVADLDRAVERGERAAATERLVVGVQLEERLAGVDHVAGLGEADDARGGAAPRPPCARGPPRGATPRRRRPSRRAAASTPRARRATARRRPRSRARRRGRRPGPRSSRGRRRTRVPSRSRAAGSSPVMPQSASISWASASVTATTSSGPPPRSTSTASATSSALPAVRPSGVSIVGEERDRGDAVVGAEADHRARRARRRVARSFMNAPEPTFTSSTSDAGALGDLLRHDRRGDEGDRLDGARSRRAARRACGPRARGRRPPRR